MTLIPKTFELSSFEDFRKQSFEFLIRTIATVLQILNNGFSDEKEVTMTCLLTRHSIDLEHFDLSYFHHNYYAGTSLNVQLQKTSA